MERAEGVRGKRRVFEAIFPRGKKEELEKIRARMPTPKIFG